jgi:hypothetical protein
MSNTIIRNIIRFIFLVLLQVLVFNNIQVFSFITPFIYILFIILLPFETPRWLRLLLGFFLGLFVDMFSGTGGIHTAATVLMAFISPWVQNMVSSKEEYEPGDQPGIKNQGFRWFFFYSLILTSVHHIFLFYLEIFSFSGFFSTLYHALLNIIFTMVFIITSQYIFYRGK